MSNVERVSASEIKSFSERLMRQQNADGFQGAGLRPRPCLVCEKPCKTEGQLCRTCAEAGHRVTDHEVIVAIDVHLPPEWWDRQP